PFLPWTVQTWRGISALIVAGKMALTCHQQSGRELLCWYRALRFSILRQSGTGQKRRHTPRTWSCNSMCIDELEDWRKAQSAAAGPSPPDRVRAMKAEELLT